MTFKLFRLREKKKKKKGKKVDKQKIIWKKIGKLNK